MNRKLIVTLLKKDIQELDLITEGFMEMTEFPKAIINLALRKTADIQSYIKQLENATNDSIAASQPTPVVEIEHISEILDKVEEPATLASEVEELQPSTKEISEEESSFNIELEIAEESEEALEEKIKIDETVAEETDNFIEPEAIESEPIVIELEPEVMVAAPEIIEPEIIETETIEPEIIEPEIIVAEDKPELEVTEPEISKIIEVTEASTTTVTETKTIVEDTKRTILAERISSQTTSRNDSLSKVDNTLSSTIANKKIDDIKQAISIGDRFRFQRELFRGNGEEMNKTLSYINQLATFGEVQSFLNSKYGWEAENTTADDFFQIVRRKFL